MYFLLWELPASTYVLNVFQFSLLPEALEPAEVNVRSYSISPVALIYQLITDPQQNPADHMAPFGITHLGF